MTESSQPEDPWQHLPPPPPGMRHSIIGLVPIVAQKARAPEPLFKPLPTEEERLQEQREFDELFYRPQPPPPRSKSRLLIASWSKAPSTALGAHKQDSTGIEAGSSRPNSSA